MRLRLAAVRLALLLGAGRGEVDRLFARTAAAFCRPVPAFRARGTRGRLLEYAWFTRQQAEAALAGRQDLQALEGRLFVQARSLGRGYRRRLRVRSLPDAMEAARLIYAVLGIDFRGDRDGSVEIRRCAFAAVYTPQVCRVISALDRGLLAGLTGGRELAFQQRLTEGAPACRAFLGGAVA